MDFQLSLPQKTMKCLLTGLRIMHLRDSCMVSELFDNNMLVELIKPTCLGNIFYTYPWVFGTNLVCPINFNLGGIK